MNCGRTYGSYYIHIIFTRVEVYTASEVCLVRQTRAQVVHYAAVKSVDRYVGTGKCPSHECTMHLSSQFNTTKEA